MPSTTVSDVMTITNAASSKLAALLADADAAAFRLEVQPGGCSGFRYQMGFDDPGADDLTGVIEGLPVAIDPESAKLVSGVVIDYSEDLDKSGFSVTNPNARSCGCGKSFS